MPMKNNVKPSIIFTTRQLASALACVIMASAIISVLILRLAAHAPTVYVAHGPTRVGSFHGHYRSNSMSFNLPTKP